MIYPDGDEYKGAWENDMRSGQGKMVWAIGDEYEGTAWLGQAPQRNPNASPYLSYSYRSA